MIPSTPSLVGFIAAALVILLIPGPGVLYVVSRSVTEGRRAGLVSVLGLSTGVFAHIGAATVGLSAILLASATAFTIIKILGAAYLIYLGFRLLVDPRTSALTPTVPRSYRRLFVDGVIITVFNPKVAIFFLAFLPQFVDPSRGAVPSQLLFLGLIYIALAIVTDGTYALLAGTLAEQVGSRRTRQKIAQRFAGIIYIGLGIGSTIAGRRP